MKSRKWLILLLAIITMMSLATYTGVTRSFFVDDEKSTDDALGIRWGLSTLNDGFEATGAAWDDYWDENGTTTWIQDTAKPHGGTYNAYISNVQTPGYLTSDEINASTADNITVSFWFNIKLLNKGPLYIQTYNGTAYNNWYDLVTYPGVVKNTWIQFSQTITDSQYFKSNFRIRFDGSGLNTDAFIDDVLIVTNQ